MFRNIISLLVLLLLLACSKDKLDPVIIAQTEDIVVQTMLSDNLKESSGLIFFDAQIWSHNDSGDAPRIYNIASTQSSVLQDINFSNAQNVDWEDMAQDAQHLYIGDFGNNSGRREDLTIYKLPKSNLNENSDAAMIRFQFSDQDNFNPEFEMHNFDCEAMIASGDYLYLFSKNHLNQQSKLYRLPKNPGVHTAELINGFDAQGLITGAAFDEETNTICLLGFNTNVLDYHPFIWLIYDFDTPDFFAGQMRRIELPIQTQTEGICAIGNEQFLISSENENGSGAFLYLLDVEKWK